MSQKVRMLEYFRRYPHGTELDISTIYHLFWSDVGSTLEQKQRFVGRVVSKVNADIINSGEKIVPGARFKRTYRLTRV